MRRQGGCHRAGGGTCTTVLLAGGGKSWCGGWVLSRAAGELIGRGMDTSRNSCLAQGQGTDGTAAFKQLCPGTLDTPLPYLDPVLPMCVLCTWPLPLGVYQRIPTLYSPAPACGCDASPPLPPPSHTTPRVMSWTRRTGRKGCWRVAPHTPRPTRPGARWTPSPPISQVSWLEGKGGTERGLDVIWVGWVCATASGDNSTA